MAWWTLGNSVMTATLWIQTRAPTLVPAQSSSSCQAARRSLTALHACALPSTLQSVRFRSRLSLAPSGPKSCSPVLLAWTP
eukprot:855128-Rhodomonas_salina.2